MFGLFKSAPFEDKELGTLDWSGGYWNGALRLAFHGEMKLLISGSRHKPDDDSLALAGELPGRFASFVAQIQTSLFEHYTPYREAQAAGELPTQSKPFPKIDNAESIWKHVAVVNVLIEPMGGVPTIEIAYTTAWDEEHTVGVRLQQWKFIELCGSV